MKKIGNALFLQFIQSGIGGVRRYKNSSRLEKVKYKRQMTAWYNRLQEQKDEELRECHKRFYEVAEVLGVTVKQLEGQIKNNQ